MNLYMLHIKVYTRCPLRAPRALYMTFKGHLRSPNNTETLNPKPETLNPKP